MPRFTVLRVSVGIAVLVALLRLQGPAPLELLDRKALDFRYVLRGPLEAAGEVVIVGLDQESLDEVGRWPWPRARMAELIDRASEAGATAVGLDIVFAQPDTGIDRNALAAAVAANPTRSARGLLDAVDSELTGDARFAAALRRSDRVILGYYFERLDSAGPSAITAEEAARLPALSVRAIGGATPASVPLLTTAKEVRANVATLAEAAAGQGHLNVLPDADGINRRVPLAMAVGDRLVPSLGLELLRRYGGGQAAVVTLAPGEVAGIRMGNRALPVDAGGQLWVNYLGPPHTFTHVSAADVLAGRAPAEALAGKIALVGFTALGFDEKATPFAAVGPGVEVQATVIDNLLHDRGLLRPRWLPPLEAAVVVLLGVAVGLCLRRLRGAGGWVLALAIGFLYAAATQYAFAAHGLVLSAVYPLATILFCTLGTAIFRAVSEEREKRKIRDAFSRYLNPEVTEMLAREPSRLRLGGERRQVTIFFSDIRGFTSVSEKLDPEALGELLNEYLGAMTDIVFRHEGLLDKYIGDAIMAFWGAPIAAADHAARCCRAALEMRVALATLHARWRETGKPLIEIGIGINSGEAAVGNFGSAQRFSYTAMGDDVNLASRLEGLNKAYGSRILVSEVTREAIGDEFVCREIDRVQVKGRSQPVAVHELLGFADADRDGRLGRLAADFGAALAAYRARDFDAALARLETLHRQHPEDQAIVAFMARCEELRAAPPAAGWDGVYVAQTK